MRLLRLSPKGRASKVLCETSAGLDAVPIGHDKIGVPLAEGQDGNRYFMALGLAEAERLRDQLNDNINFQRSKQQ